jgi:glycosyltransferase involved in cell wall biosynthesis
MKRILILYRELAGYFVECINHLCERYDVQADIVSYPVNADAPFAFSFSSRISLHERNTLSNEQLVALANEGRYDLIFCGGWGDKGYLEAVRHKKGSSLLGFDNQWNGSLKHRLAAFYAQRRLRPLFDVAFVPGKKQAEFAQHMGFALKHIVQGAYACDVAKFRSIYATRDQRPIRNGKKKLIYAGRYAEEKFIGPLCKVFAELQKERSYNWELHCIGTGPLWEKRVEAAGIFHHGFMQPAQLHAFMTDGDAFVLPSTFEPWGVVVHEFAAAGYPLLLSSSIGSAEKFLEVGKNGFLFRSGDAEDLRSRLRQLLSLDELELKTMNQESIELAQQITPDTWAQSIYSIM